MSEVVGDVVDSATAVNEPSSEAQAAKPGRRKGGRPTKLTNKLIEEACKYVSVGVPAELAFESLGINRVTFWRWKKAAEEGDELYAQAFDRLRQAKAAIVIRLSQKWIKAVHDSKSPDVIYKAMHTLDPQLFRLVEQGPGISVTQNVNNDGRTVVMSGGAPNGVAAQLTVEGADAIQRKILLGGQTPEEIMDKFRRMKPGNSVPAAAIDTEGEASEVAEEQSEESEEP